MVIWIVGLSGAGKSTVGRKLYDKIRACYPNTVLLDGDNVRQVFAHENPEQDYSLAARRKSAERLHGLSLLLDQQGIHVVCCAISMFRDVTALNRQRFSRFVEVFMDVPLEVLSERDGKGLYARAQAGLMTYVVGVDLPFERPQAPEFTFTNSFTEVDAESYANAVWLAIEGQL
ncbi:adenylyl-sulfate kinase [Pokkaliibacter plantistimulans]|uniref:Adenylyl-sulfate kinase n=1 Tax=Proteobacteria bacterium 228 TaxID=2083153 RepID=A0A2S5KUL0_9PROT|nr:adenylyl-sulfate kinase [Pokkaliibacter plantistimulans]PPC78428.1 adenylyl-sulfate kinase [Pokkaliibacter plantistimulans]